MTICAISITAALTAATIIEMTAEYGSALTPFAMISATPFHCSAAGIANWSETIVADRAHAVGIRRQEQQEEQRHARSRPSDDADHVADRLLARLARRACSPA